MTPGETIFRIYQELSATLAPFRHDIVANLEAVQNVYDPLQYAHRPWRRYLERYVDGPRRVLFLGMNPGPWGMAQTGIPFGEVQAVRDWMGIEEPVETPENLHPARPVLGFRCPRSEVSGRRLWALMEARFGTADCFFRDHAVLNFCPLVFMAPGGRNITPDKLPRQYRTFLEESCQDALLRSVQVLKPQFLVGVGRFALERLVPVRDVLAMGDPVQILHPSPASPAANRGWAETVTAQLEAARVW